MSLGRSSPDLYPHILLVREVLIYKSSGKGYHSVLVRKMFTGPDGLINIEFGTGYNLKVASRSLFWEDHWIENRGIEQLKLDLCRWLPDSRVISI